MMRTSASTFAGTGPLRGRERHYARWTAGEGRGYILHVMKGIASFHPVELGFFESTIAPLIREGSVDLDPYLDRTIPARRAASRARRFVRALAAILGAARPP